MCAGDWALSDITTNGEHTVSTANAVGSVPSSAVVVLISGTVIFKAVGTPGTSKAVLIDALSISGDSNSETDELAFGAVESNGLIAGDIIAKIPFRLYSYVTNHIVNPEIIINVAALSAGDLLEMRVTGYYLA